jgi:hypothetical protein
MSSMSAASEEQWRKSTASTPTGNCVEVGHVGAVIAVRDTTDRDGGTLGFPASAWAAFTAARR